MAAAEDAPVLDLPCGTPIDSAESFAELVAWLPTMLEELLASPIYNGVERPPRNQRGIYLFTDGGQHLYVGRTGITARARAGTTESNTSFRARFDNHTQRGTRPGTAPFANRLMRERATEGGIEIPHEWWTKREAEGAEIFGLFCEAKKRIFQMECRVIGFDDDTKGIRSTVGETYVHARLGTPHNEFLTS